MLAQHDLFVIAGRQLPEELHLVRRVPVVPRGAND